MEDGIPLVVREVNDRTYNILWGLGAEDGDFACECGRNSCVERVASADPIKRFRACASVAGEHTP